MVCRSGSEVSAVLRGRLRTALDAQGNERIPRPRLHRHVDCSVEHVPEARAQ